MSMHNPLDACGLAISFESYELIATEKTTFEDEQKRKQVDVKDTKVCM